MNQPGHRVPQILYEDDEDDDLICHEILDDEDEETPVVPLGGVGRGGGGTPLPPSLDRPWCIARMGVYKSSEAPGRHS